MIKFQSKLVNQLIDLNIIQPEKVELYSPTTRDNPGQQVWRCSQSGVIFLDSKTESKKDRVNDLSYWGVDERAKFLLQSKEDDDRRAELIASFLPSANYLDIGTGLGGILDRSVGLCKSIVAVEPQFAARNTLKKLNYQVFGDIVEVDQTDFDLVTMFHVFEHLHQPLNILSEVKKRLSSSGSLIIEVPHAKDILLDKYRCDSFKSFTLWSEHLVLHTKESLRTMLNAAGFIVESIDGVQRYDLANHLYWLAKGLPGGHDIWKGDFSSVAKHEYALSLINNNKSDTIVAKASLNK